MLLLALQQCIREAMPILDSNLAMAAVEFHAGRLSEQGRRFVQERHASAVRFLETDIPVHPDPLVVRQMFQACAPLTLDIRSGIHEMPADGRALQLYERWWRLFQQAGFTDTYTGLEIPAWPNESSKIRGSSSTK
jgi:hypothetical protein